MSIENNKESYMYFLIIEPMKLIEPAKIDEPVTTLIWTGTAATVKDRQWRAGYPADS
jgi:hypothetical protein